MNLNFDNLDTFYKNNKIKITEGYTQNIKQQVYEIINICKKIDPKLILEIGFNGGHSSELFLNNTNAYVYSFDIGYHFYQYLKFGKIFINHKYPNRHTLVLGDSRESIPRFYKNHLNLKFDIIFIDGGHDYNIALEDILNCRNLANNNTILIVDDIIRFNKSWEAGYTIDPSKAWNECINNNIIEELNYFEWSNGRGMTIGKYKFT